MEQRLRSRGCSNRAASSYHGVCVRTIIFGPLDLNSANHD